MEECVTYSRVGKLADRAYCVDFLSFDTVICPRVYYRITKFGGLDYLSFESVLGFTECFQ
jgi:hypothetical protein